MRFEYTVHIANESGEFIASFTDFPEAITSGETWQEALAESRDALEEAIANRIKQKMDIPSPSEQMGSKVQVSAQIAIKASLYLALKKRNMNYCQFAKILQCDEKEVRRLVDPLHNTKLIKLDEALRALQVEIVVESDQSVPIQKFAS